jgi:ribosomal protein S18 acetylase RimI-like enzyme
MRLMTTVAIRLAQNDADFRDLHALLVEYEHDLPPRLRHGSVPVTSALKNAYARRDAAFLATFEKDVIGCVAVADIEPGTAVMIRLFVKPQHRGRGAARALVTSALNFLKERRYARVVLDTDKTLLTAAYRLYRSLGFEECEAYGPVDYENPTFMELHLE